MATTNLTELKKALDVNGIFSYRSFSREEYIEELLKFQRFAGQLLLDDESATLNEVIAAASSAARQKNVERSQDFVAGIRDLKAIEKEIAIHMSGKRAEDAVAYSLTFVNRPLFRDFRNVYVADHETETEIDNVILTDNGIIVVEVKAAKRDITIDEDGRLLYSNSISYHNVSIGDKMSAKRRLLKTRIESKLRERGLDIPVYIDSYLVFANPKRTEITITDRFHKEQWCRRGKLQYIVSEFTSDVTYTSEEFAQMEEIIDSLECNFKRYTAGLDLPAIRDSFVAMYALITEQPVVNEIKLQSVHDVEVPSCEAASVETQKRPSNKWNILSIAASVAIMLATSIAAASIASRSAS